MEHNKQMLNLILNRRSCRNYRPEPLDRPALMAIVEAGRYAPSGMNRQNNHFYIITERELLERMTRMVSASMESYASRDFRYGAPILIVVTNRKDNGVALQDAACAMENMMLAASSMGVGSCWINAPAALSDDPDMRALLAPAGLGENERICASLALGYPEGELPSGRMERTGNQITWVTGK